MSCRVPYVHVYSYNIYPAYLYTARMAAPDESALPTTCASCSFSWPSTPDRVARLLRHFIDTVQSVPQSHVALEDYNFRVVTHADHSTSLTSASRSEWLSTTAARLVGTAPPAGSPASPGALTTPSGIRGRPQLPSTLLAFHCPTYATYGRFGA